MAKTEKQEATILPIQVLGTVSPYPIVVTVIYKKKLWVCQTEYRKGFEFNCLEFRSVDAEISVYD